MAEHDPLQHNKAVILAIIKYFLILLVAGLCVYFGFRLFIILMPFVIGTVLARLSTQTVSGIRKGFVRLGRKLRQLRGKDDTGSGQGLARSKLEKQAALVVYILILLLFLGLVVGSVLLIISQLRALAANLPKFVNTSDFLNQLVDQLDHWSNRLGGLIPPQYLLALESELVNIQQRFLQSVSSLVGSTLNALAGFAAHLPILFFMFVVVIMSGFYFISDTKAIYSFLYRNIPSRTFRDKTLRLVNSLFHKLFRVIGGYLLLLVLTYIMALIGLLLIRMPYAAVIASVVALVDLLPILGISTTMIPIALYQFIQGNIWGGIGALLILVTITMIRRFIEPPILGNAMQLHPLATLFSMILGIRLYGLGGLLLGPIVLVVALEVIRLFEIDQRFRVWFGNLLNRLSP